MPGFVDTVSVFNSAVRTLLALLVVGGLAAGGWYGYTLFSANDVANRQLARTRSELEQARLEMVEQQVQLEEKDAAIGELETTVSEQQEQIARLDTALRLLKIDHRVARIEVLEQGTNPETGELESLVEFQELDEQGRTLGEARRFRIQGDVLYVDSWIVKFDDKYVEQSDLHRSTSLVLFRRIFGAAQEPRHGYSLDTVGRRPGAYARGNKMSNFEKKIWDDFWSVANNEAKQAELGIRAAHGEAPSIKMEEGKAYRITLRASGGLSVDVDETATPSQPST